MPGEHGGDEDGGDGRGEVRGAAVEGEGDGVGGVREPGGAVREGGGGVEAEARAEPHAGVPGDVCVGGGGLEEAGAGGSGGGGGGGGWWDGEVRPEPDGAGRRRGEAEVQPGVQPGPVRGGEREAAGRQLERVMEGVVRDPWRRVGELELESEEELERQLVEWNRTEAEYPMRYAHELFEERARTSPQAVAVISGTRRITFEELDRRA